jgi:hypothetical protein
MRNDVLNGASAPSMSSLASGILADVQQLITQQTQLVRLEIREDLRKARTGAIFLGAGLGVTAIGGLLFCFMLPYFSIGPLRTRSPCGPVSASLASSSSSAAAARCMPP